MKVGILGGGQLGRMIALAGYPLGLTFRFFDPNPESPAGQIGELTAADYDDERALHAFATGLDVATYEFESVPISAVEFVSQHIDVHPPQAALAAAQDRLAERRLFQKLNIQVAAYSAVDTVDDLASAAASVGFPSILKTRTLGYDGKGQARAESPDELRDAWAAVGSRPCILERVVEFRRELSVLAVRARDGSLLVYPLVENHHSEGILRASFAPADVGVELQREAESIASRVATELRYVGVFAIELFDTPAGLVANEMAPRVHNSGHWTIEGAETSQFENHLRAVLGLPLGPTGPLGAAAMLNLIGRIPDLSRLLTVPGAHVHLYGKSARHKRKLGHVTVVATDRAETMASIAELRAIAASATS